MDSDRGMDEGTPEARAIITPLIATARDYVSRALRLTDASPLDLGEASLAYIDAYTESARTAGPLRPEVLDLVARALGAYFGEVVRRRLGGRWEGVGDDAATWVVAVENGPLRVHPVAMAACALAGGDLAGQDASMTTDESYREALAVALERVPPVDAAYFYSLTGRLEMLETACDILIEVRRLRSEQR
jgi:hypothetical protein